MKKITLSENIARLRKSKGVTQEQLANAVNVTFQSVSKWENGQSVPGTLMHPKIAEFFNVSIDCLMYGRNYVYDDIQYMIFDKVKNAKEQMSKESYEKALDIFAAAFHGICKGNLKRTDEIWMYDNPSHISNQNGLALLCGKGFGAVVTRDFFETVTREDIDRYSGFFQHISHGNNLLVIAAIISMSDISFDELKEKTGLDESALKNSLGYLIKYSLVDEKEIKHKSIGATYVIGKMYHTCICLLLCVMSVLVMGRENGISCVMGYGDYPIKL